MLDEFCGDLCFECRCPQLHQRRGTAQEAVFGPARDDQRAWPPCGGTCSSAERRLARNSSDAQFVVCAPTFRPQLVAIVLAPLLGGAVREVQFMEVPRPGAAARPRGRPRRAASTGHEEPRAGLVAHQLPRPLAAVVGRRIEIGAVDGVSAARLTLFTPRAARAGPAAVDAVDPLVEAVVVEEERGRRAGRVRDLELDEAVLLLLRVRREVRVGLARRRRRTTRSTRPRAPRGGDRPGA